MESVTLQLESLTAIEVAEEAVREAKRMVDAPAEVIDQMQMFFG